MTRRRFLRTAAACVGGLGCGLGLYAWRWEPHWLSVAHQPLALKGLPASWVGARIVQLSDLHIGPVVSDAYLRSCFDRVQAMRPDVVVYTGDFTTYDANVITHARAMFPHLPTGARATFGVLGNHDYGLGYSMSRIADQLAGLASDAGVTMLRNACAEVDGLQFFGLDDLWAGRFNPVAALAGYDASRDGVALSHNPDTADRAGWDGFQGWILAGHTHGGQCRPPFFSPPLLPVQNRRYTQGVFELTPQRNMYINPGLGYLQRIRFGIRPEATVFHLEAA